MENNRSAAGSFAGENFGLVCVCGARKSFGTPSGTSRQGRHPDSEKTLPWRINSSSRECERAGIPAQRARARLLNFENVVWHRKARLIIDRLSSPITRDLTPDSVAAYPLGSDNFYTLFLTRKKKLAAKLIIASDLISSMSESLI